MVRARAICNREIRSATTLVLPGMCLARKHILQDRHATINCRSKDMSCGSLAVCLLITVTTAVLSERNNTR